MRMQHQQEAYASDLRDSSHVTRYLFSYSEYINYTVFQKKLDP